MPRHPGPDGDPPRRRWIGPPRTLRARLTVVLLALAAAGLVLLSAITWGSQRRFLQQQTDSRAQAAVRFIASQVLLKNRYEAATGTTADPFAGGRPQRGDRGGRDAGPPSPPSPPPVDARSGRGDLPPGTYGEVRTAGGVRIGSPYVLRTLDGRALPPPRLPARITYDEPITVSAASGGARYRVVASPAPFVTAAGERAVAVVALPLDGDGEQLRNLLLVDAVVIVLILAALGVAASRLVGVELAPLQQIAADADDIAGGQLQRRVPDAAPGTEVGRLAAALNAMLTRIEQAFAERQRSEDKLRRFLSDASHELRTPLASIRGYAELQRTGVLTAAEDRERAVARIEEQAARMGLLVEDLLALARLDEERAPARELVALAELARDAAADARVLDPAREVTLTVNAEPLVLGDDARLRQVLANLLGNAVAHTPAGTPVAVTVACDAEAAVITVDDAGSGIPPAQRAQIFERFAREAGGTARTRGRAGAGLGLAVVDGIVRQHGGSVVVQDGPLGGARFTVTLPIAAPADADRAV